MSQDKLQELAGEERERQAQYKQRIFCCVSTACVSSGAGQTRQAFQQAVDGLHLGDEVEVVSTGCMGLCSRGPLVRVEAQDTPGVLYQDVSPEVAHQVVAEHLGVGGQAEVPSPHDFPHLRASLRQAKGKEGLDRHVLSEDIPFYTRQQRVVLTECGQIDPENLSDYLLHGGYTALAHVLFEMTPEQVIEELIASGLRGRGGAGFPTGLKWRFVRESPGDPKYVIVNGDEGDPGAYMDRTVMEDAPHRVLEGMMIAAYATGASYGYLYVRGEYPIAVNRLRQAIRTARRRGILGKSVMGTDFKFDADVRIGAGAFVCGEETALIKSVEGKRGAPRMRPPYPSTAGLWSQPTLINNVETMANVPSIINRGADWFASIGTENSKGTKVFALAGQLNNTGLIEVPMGITLREIVYEIGGGIPNGRNFKAVQTGGPSGGCIPAEYLDTPVDYKSLTALGSIMGSGGMIVIDDSSSMPEIAKFFMDFSRDESCGKCVPCRVGTLQLHRLLEKLTGGRGTRADLDKLESLCETVARGSLCGLGQNAPNPIISTLKYFHHEYEALVQDGALEGAAAD